MTNTHAAILNCLDAPLPALMWVPLLSKAMFRDSSIAAEAMGYEVDETDADWRSQVTGDKYHVHRETGTEPGSPGSTPTPRASASTAAAPAAELSRSAEKFHSGCG